MILNDDTRCIFHFCYNDIKRINQKNEKEEKKEKKQTKKK